MIPHCTSRHMHHIASRLFGARFGRRCCIMRPASLPRHSFAVIFEHQKMQCADTGYRIIEMVLVNAMCPLFTARSWMTELVQFFKLMQTGPHPPHLSACSSSPGQAESSTMPGCRPRSYPRVYRTQRQRSRTWGHELTMLPKIIR